MASPTDQLSNTGSAECRRAVQPVDLSHLPHAVAKAILEAHARIVLEGSARRLWVQVLTEDDRRQLGDDFCTSYRQLGTIDMWRAVRSGTLIKATLDVAFEIGFLTDRSYRWLLRETGNDAQHVGPTPGQTIERPTWNRDTGTLGWGADVIRKFRIQREASQTEQILNAFQAANWASRVENPLAALLHVQVAQALRYLNGEQSVIRFHAQESSRYLRWERTTADPVDAV